MTTVSRPPWDTKKTAAQVEALAEAKKRASKYNDLQRKADAAEADMWAAVLAARELDVTDLAICADTGIARATLNRRYGTRKEPKDQASDSQPA